MRMLMLSRDSSGLKSDSDTAKRWRLLRDQGVELDVVVMARDKGSWQEEGIKVTCGGGENIIKRFWNCRRIALKQALICDLITAQDPFELGLIAYLATRRFRKRFEIQDHGGFFDGVPADEPLWAIRSRLAWWLVRRAHRIRMVSPGSLKRLTAAGFGEKTYHLPIAAHGRFRDAVRKPDPNLLVTVSRLIPVKRIDLLLQAFAELKTMRLNAKLAIVGDGPLRQSLQNLAAQLGVSKDVQFVGEADPLPWLERAACFVMLSKHEGWGVAAVEAALAGVPVVMSDTGCAAWLAERGRARVARSVLSRDIAEEMEAAITQMMTVGKFSGVLSLEEMEQTQVAHWRELFEEKPRTLMCVQAVDEKDPLFGFFVSWLRAFAEHGRAIVCALRVSDPLPEMPSEIEIRRSRPSNSRSKFLVLWNIARISWHERFRYESVFIRGDAQYLACLGWLWKLFGKKTVFWYTHYSAKNPWFWLAIPWAHDVVTAVTESNPLNSSLKIGHHIDTGLFTDKQIREHSIPRVLILGRVSPVKRVPWMVESLRPFYEEGKIELKIIGKATDTASRNQLVSALPKGVTWNDADVAYSETPRIFSDADIFINATPGSMDKTILEAAASGAVVLAATPGIKRGLPEDLHWLNFSDEAELRHSLERILLLTQEERQKICQRLREWVIREHGLANNVASISAILQERSSCLPFKQRLKRMWWRFYSRRKTGLCTFMFHSFDGKGSAGWDIIRFRAFLVRLRSAGTKIVNPEENISTLVAAKEATVLLTIDDATSDLKFVIQELKRFHVPAVVFAPCGINYLRASDGKKRTILSESDLILLRSESGGLLSIGGHGVSHRSLIELDKNALESELKMSLEFVRRIQGLEAHSLFAYPRGKLSSVIAESVAVAGFDAAFTVIPGAYDPAGDMFALPRYPVLHWMDSKDVLRSASL